MPGCLTWLSLGPLRNGTGIYTGVQMKIGSIFNYGFTISVPDIAIP